MGRLGRIKLGVDIVDVIAHVFEVISERIQASRDSEKDEKIRELEREVEWLRKNDKEKEHREED
jgi:hypothetical protein